MMLVKFIVLVKEILFLFYCYKLQIEKVACFVIWPVLFYQFSFSGHCLDCILFCDHCFWHWVFEPTSVSTCFQHILVIYAKCIHKVLMVVLLNLCLRHPSHTMGPFFPQTPKGLCASMVRPSWLWTALSIASSSGNFFHLSCCANVVRQDLVSDQSSLMPAVQQVVLFFENFAYTHTVCQMIGWW